MVYMHVSHVNDDTHVHVNIFANKRNGNDVALHCCVQCTHFTNMTFYANLST